MLLLLSVAMTPFFSSAAVVRIISPPFWTCSNFLTLLCMEWLSLLSLASKTVSFFSRSQANKIKTSRIYDVNVVVQWQ
jgi:hypothetical protein